MDSPTSAAVHLILTAELVPALREVVTELGGDDTGSLVHARPTAVGAAHPTNSAAAIVHHLCGVLTSWGAACLGGEQVSRERESEFAYDGPVLPELDRLAALADRVPDWTTAALRRGGLAHPTGTAFPVERARAAGTLTIEWVLAHILHDVATHLGHLEVTRDIVMSARPR